GGHRCRSGAAKPRRQECDGSRARGGRLLIRPTSGRQTGAELLERTAQSKGIETSQPFGRVTHKQHRRRAWQRPQTEPATSLTARAKDDRLILKQLNVPT